MKWLSMLLLLFVFAAAGCGGDTGGAVGDANDPALNGDDEAAMQTE
mgnify:CR=1 FL=1